MLFKDGADSKVYMGRYEGLLPWLENRWKDTESENVKEELEGYRVEDACATCGGLRLCPEALHVKVKGYSIGDLVLMPIDDLVTLLRNMEWTSQENAIVGQAIQEVQKRLSFICDVGVGYLSLHRRADTLSGGESQRIRLATQIGSKLSGVLYVLDEPTIGLHARDTSRLIRTLQSIRDLGNSVIVVEHDRDTMMAADAIVEMGPAAVTLKAVAARIDMLSPEAVTDSIAVSQLEAVSVADARAELEFMFGKLVAKNPALVGGKLPDEGFYAGATKQ